MEIVRLFGNAAFEIAQIVETHLVCGLATVVRESSLVPAETRAVLALLVLKRIVAQTRIGEKTFYKIDYAELGEVLLYPAYFAWIESRGVHKPLLFQAVVEAAVFSHGSSAVEAAIKDLYARGLLVAAGDAAFRLGRGALKRCVFESEFENYIKSILGRDAMLVVRAIFAAGPRFSIAAVAGKKGAAEVSRVVAMLCGLGLVSGADGAFAANTSHMLETLVLERLAHIATENIGEHAALVLRAVAALHIPDSRVHEVVLADLTDVRPVLASLLKHGFVQLSHRCSDASVFKTEYVWSLAVPEAVANIAASAASLLERVSVQILDEIGPHTGIEVADLSEDTLLLMQKAYRISSDLLLFRMYSKSVLSCYQNTNSK